MYKSFDERKKEIEAYYEKEKQAELERLKAGLEKELAQSRQESAEVDKDYAAKSNDLAVQYERNRRNFNLAAAARGLSTGTASQAALSQNAAYMRQAGNLRQNRLSARERGLAALRELNESYTRHGMEYSAESDKEKARTILQEREKHMQKMLSQAATLAQYGDFSLYREIYGPEQAKNMEQVWFAQNPNLAFSMGKISIEQYRRITGRNPPGYGGGGHGGGRRRKKKKGGEVPIYTPQGSADTRHPGQSHRNNYEW